MRTLDDILTNSRLAILQATTEDDAVNELRAARPGGAPLSTWRAGDGFAPVEPADGGGIALVPGSQANDFARALADFQRLDQEAILLAFGVGAQKSPGSSRMRFEHQLRGLADDRPIRTWIVVASTSDRDRTALEGIFSELQHNRAELTATARRQAAPVAAAGPRAAAAGAIPWDDIADIDQFDQPAWTERLDQMTFDELRKLCSERDDLVQACIARIDALRSNLRRVLIHKDDVIDLMTTCTVAQIPLLLLGTWGTAKSMLVREFSKGLGIEPVKRTINSEDELIEELSQDAAAGSAKTGRRAALSKDDVRRATRHFEYLVTRFTTPEEMLGPVNIDLMLKQAVYLRQTESLLPRAEIVFLDEVFKANSAILNALLSIINERLFYNAGLTWTVNMVMLFGASNEPPQEADLGAFFDRFPAKILCDPVRSDQLEDLLEASNSQQYLGLARGELPDSAVELRKRRMVRQACVNDFRLLRKVSLFRFGGHRLTSGAQSESFKNRFVQLLRNLRDEYDISDRSCGHFYRLARARALLAGRDEMNATDCKVLYYCGKSESALRLLPSVVDELL